MNPNLIFNKFFFLIYFNFLIQIFFTKLCILKDN